MQNNIISNKITQYNDMIYNGKPVSFSDYVSDKFNNIHKELYQNALAKYISKAASINGQDETIYKKTHKFIEIKNTEYYKASKVVVIDKTTKQHNKEIVDLLPYWNNYQEKQISQHISYIYLDPESKADAKIIYIDYVNDKSKLKSKFTEHEFWVDNKFITDDIPLGDELKLTNTFSALSK